MEEGLRMETGLKMTMKHDARSSYNYQVIDCPTAQRLQDELEEHKDIAGFYWYTIPQKRGCLLIIATANIDVIKQKTELQAIGDLKPLTEAEAKKLMMKCEYCRELDQISNFITWLYENSYNIMKPVLEKKE